MSNATVPARLAGLGKFHPDGAVSFRLADPISLAQLRQLTGEDWISNVTTTDGRAGRVSFRFVATVDGHQVTVTGYLSTNQRRGTRALRTSVRWDEPALFDVADSADSGI